MHLLNETDAHMTVSELPIYKEEYWPGFKEVLDAAIEL